MPKIKRPSMKYTVSFNGVFGDKEYGDVEMHTADHEGNDINELAAEVIADDPRFPMVFRRNKNKDGIVGSFVSTEDDEYEVAVMVLTKVYF